MDKQFEELITCPVCLDRYKQPKILPCQHTFCLKPCLQKLVIEKSIRCPQCRSTHKLPKNGISTLPNNLTMLAILELPGKKTNKIEEACQECLKEQCNPRKCSHCEKKLCASCGQVHCQQLVQSLSRSTNQLKCLLPKLSDMISDLEDKQMKSNNLAESVKSDVDQAIDHCMAKLKARQQNLHEQIDSFVATEIQQLRIEQENVEMEMAMVNSHCDVVDKKCKLFAESDNPDVLTPSEASLLTQQSNEHLRNLKLISNNIEDKIAHHIKFRNEGERSLLGAVDSFGEVTVNAPSRLSFSLGSDPDINDVEIHRALHAPHGRRRTEIAEPYVPSFSLAPNDTSLVSGYASSPSNGSHSPHDSLGDTGNPSQRSFTNLPVPGASLQPHRMPRPRRASYRLQPTDNHRTLPPGGGDTAQSGDSPALVQYASIRGTLWQYRSKGPVKRWFGEKGSDIGCLNWPRGVAASAHDRIVVADSSNHRIHLFESSGEAALTFGSYGSEEGEFDCLSGVHVTAQGWVITTDRYNHRVQIFDSMGRFIRMFGHEGTGEGELSYPWGVATDNMGFVYVCDKDNHRVQIFTLDGQFIRKFGRIGSCDSQFDSPHYLAVTSDNKVVVSDSGNHRIQVFDKYGRFLLKFGREGSADGLLKYPRGVAVDRHGNIVVGDSGNNRVQVYTSDGTYVAGFGSWGPAPGQMKGIEGIALLSNNDIAVSDRENHRIQIF